MLGIICKIEQVGMTSIRDQSNSYNKYAGSNTLAQQRGIIRIMDEIICIHMLTCYSDLIADQGG